MIDTVLKSFAEAAKYDIQLESVGTGSPPGPLFTECAGTSAYRVLSTPSPASGPFGTVVTIFGTGYSTSSPLSVTVGSVPATVSSGGLTDANGNVAVTFSVPTSGLSAGSSYPVSVTDASARTATSTESFSVTPGVIVPATAVSPLASYSLAISSVAWWNRTTQAWDSSVRGCQPGDRSGLQQITLTGTAQDHTTDALTFVVADPATVAPVITSGNSTTFTVGTAGTFKVTTTGFPTPGLSDVSFTGCTPSTLPSGVTFVDNHDGTATLSGTPAGGSGGTYTLCLKATSSSGIATQTFTLTVNEAPAVTSPASTTFSTGTPSAFTVTTTGFPNPSLSDTDFPGCTKSLLPTPVTFTDNGNGTATLAGTPAGTSGGTYSLCLVATNSTGTATQSFTLTVNQAPAITSAGSATFTVGTQGTFPVTASGFPAPVLSEVGPLPSGVTFTSSTGILAGTPAAGSGNNYPVTFKATSVAGTATQSFTLTVNQPPAFSSANNTTFSTRTASTFTVTTTGYPDPSLTDGNFAGCTKSTLPAGVTFTDNGNGTATLAGTPAANAGGTYTLCLKASNGVGSAATQVFTLTVNQAPAITSAGSTTFTAGSPGTFTVTATGFPAPALSETGPLPSGISFNPGTGVLSGTPAGGTGNTYPVTFKATQRARDCYPKLYPHRRPGPRHQQRQQHDLQHRHCERVHRDLHRIPRSRADEYDFRGVHERRPASGRDVH